MGRHLCDEFELVPAGTDPGYADAVLDLCHRHGATVVLPQSSFDLPGLAAARVRFATEGVAAMVASPEAVRRANDNGETFALLDACGVRGPEWRRVQGGAALAEAARELGYPARDVCMKPVVVLGLARLPHRSRPASTAATSCCTSGPAASPCGSRTSWRSSATTRRSSW